MNLKRRRDDEFDQYRAHVKPSQVPVHTVKASYDRMIRHCITQGGLWACPISGARVHARMTYRNVFNRITKLCTANDIPVVTLYCSRCDSVPQTHGGDPIWDDELVTLAM